MPTPTVRSQKTWSYIGAGVLWLVGVLILVSGQARTGAAKEAHPREATGVHSSR